MSQIALFETPAAGKSPIAALGEWVTDPAQLSFKDYRDRLAWGAPNANRTRKCINQSLAMTKFPYMAFERDNQYPNGQDAKYGKWEDALASGRSYLVGAETPMAAFLRNNTSPLNAWQQQAFVWCKANPSKMLELQTSFHKGLFYQIYQRGEFVEIGLPHHGRGGEKHWISLNGKSKVLINVD